MRRYLSEVEKIALAVCKAGIWASSFDMLKDEGAEFSGSNLMVSLSNHGPHGFQRSAVAQLKKLAHGVSPKE